MKSTNNRPPIILGATDAERLTALASKIQGSRPELAELLFSELERAEVRDDAEVPDTAVAMNSIVEFFDEAHDMPRSVQLVYPGEADISFDKISALTPMGAGLLGLSPGQSILWPDREGRERRLPASFLGLVARRQPCAA